MVLIMYSNLSLTRLQVKVDQQTEEILVFHLKNPKEDSLRKGVNVELFSTGTFTCPVEAWS